LRLDEAEHELDRDHGVDRIAAGAQHLGSGLRRERIGRRHHPALRRDRRSRLADAGRPLGRQGVGSLLREGRAGECGPYGEQGDAALHSGLPRTA
jgi:hypothetical protein